MVTVPPAAMLAKRTRELTRVIELEARYPFSAEKDRGPGQFQQLSTVDKGRVSLHFNFFCLGRFR